jgi:putative N6-adenine-specific DNA methylase
MIPAEPLEMFATCDSELESLLARELTMLGIRHVSEGFRGVAFRGDREALWRVNLSSRIANRVLVKVSSFRVRDRSDLYESVVDMPWEHVMRADQTLAIDSSVNQHPTLHSFQLVNQVVKDAVCDRFRRQSGRRPSVDRSEPDIPIHVRLDGERCSLHLDSSGARLHRRGYRTEAGQAPLRETIAAAMLLWVDYDGTVPLIDPFCGSGTILIEAALIARRIAPGLLRLRGGPGFAFQRWCDHSVGPFERLETELRELVQDEPVSQILGADTNPGVLSRARRNAERAWVRDHIQFARRDARDTVAPADAGMIITNPPYGERLSSADDLWELMGEFGTTLKREYAGWDAHILMSEPTLLKRLGLKPSRKRVVHNGPIECRYATFNMYAGSRRS